MDKKVVINNYNIKHNGINKDINIKVISDIHLCESFNSKKLDIIKDKILDGKTNYLFVCGDIIDSTNFLYKSNDLKTKYINWFKSIAKKVPIYIVLGNHDFVKLNDDKEPSYDFNEDFFNSLSSISNVYVSCKKNYYELDDIIILMIESKWEYYYEENYSEKLLIDELNKNKKHLKQKNNKLKVLLIHSPINMKNEKVISLTKDYDIVLSGHMHGGIIPFNINRFIPGNRGLISPNKNLFPKYARGYMKSNINENVQHLIISGGITKLQECTGILRKFNFLFPMEIENINVYK